MEKKYMFYFIKLATPFKTDVILFEENSNDIIVVPLVAKWFKNYVGSEKINLNINLQDLPANKFQEIVNDNYDLISINYELGKYERYNYFKGKMKKEVLDEILNPYKINDEHVKSMLNSINKNNIEYCQYYFTKILRKEKISKFLI